MLRMFFAIITMVLGFLLAVGVSGGKALLYVDVPTLILTILLPVLFLNILYGTFISQMSFRMPAFVVYSTGSPGFPIPLLLL
jgi:hypothetical protein